MKYAQESESVGSSCDNTLRFVEVLARTSHGKVELYECLVSNRFVARHYHHGGTSYEVLPGALWESEKDARRAGLAFFERWKKEFALEYLAQSVLDG